MITEEGGVPIDVGWDEIERRIREALRQLQESEDFVLRNDVNERTITHRLALYLEPYFPEWSVDIEYNRVGDAADPKRLDWNEIAYDASPEELVRDTEARTVYPDVIIHERGEPNNLLVIEVKKSSSAGSGERDRRKLEAFLEAPEFCYRHAVFIEIPVGEEHPGDPIIDCIVDSEEPTV